MINERISVIVPLYNHSKYVEDALCSVIGQTLPPYEIIVIDDGSTDDSFAKISKMASGDERIKISTRKNKGAHNTINEGLSLATGDFISILNSDDIYESDRFYRLMSHFRRDSKIDIIYSEVKFIDSNSLPIANQWYVDALEFYRENGCIFDLSVINGNFIMTTSNFFARVNVFEKIGQFAAYRYAHDLDFILRAYGEGCRHIIDDGALLNYRYHPENTIKENINLVRLEVVEIISNYICKYKNFHTQTEVDFWMDVLKKHSFCDLMTEFNLKNKIFHKEF